VIQSNSLPCVGQTESGPESLVRDVSAFSMIARIALQEFQAEA
jgi:hypothetical protein